MTIRADAQQLTPQQLVEMYVWDDRPIGGPNVFYWHPGTTAGNRAIVWQGIEYVPFPVEATGFQRTGTGELPRPKLKVSNIGGTIGAYIRQMGGGLGSLIIRKQTFGKFLDAVNFPAGNPLANPAAYLPDEIYYVARKVNENPIFLEMELAAKFDVMGIQLPRRQVMAQTCPWVYRSAECTYAGPPVQDINGLPTSSMDKDSCRKTLAACQARFGRWAWLPYGGFPASLLVRQS